MNHNTEDTEWMECVRHAVKFPRGHENDHKASPTGEQNTAGKCDIRPWAERSEFARMRQFPY